ncbi:MAG TPA: hypothetical protein VJS39_01680, partial [Gemmatimonadaceae bacterium]|nr:hypothetical protein [Gemmatimonadaceae bacterium]
LLPVAPPPPPLTLVRDVPAERTNGKWVPIISTCPVLGAAMFAAPALTDSLSGQRVGDAALSLSPGYKILAPICDTLDTISMFSLGQHIAFGITCVVLYAAWRFVRERERASLFACTRCEIAAAGMAVLALMAVYVVGAMVPRPTARLTLLSPDEIAIDFHSHTRYSWDGWSSFSPEASRRWHQASGFNVAYITDHSTFAGAEEAALVNPAHAGGGTVMLSGIEVRDRGNHLVVLGTDARDWQSYTAGNLHELTFKREVASRGSARPVVLFTLPGNLKSESAMSVDAIELSDAAPRGLSQSDAQHGEILNIGGEQNKTLLASSNNHGWANASPAWSVMEIRDWRAMTPAELDVAIRRQILRDGSSAVRVIDRRTPASVSTAGLALTVPIAVWRMLITMSWAERISWLIWIWVGFACVLTLRRFPRPQLSR